MINFIIRLRIKKYNTKIFLNLYPQQTLFLFHHHIKTEFFLLENIKKNHFPYLRFLFENVLIQSIKSVFVNSGQNLSTKIISLYAS